MTNIDVALVVPSILALLCCLYPAPWHLRTGNIPTLAMIFWMALLNFTHIVNCILWSDNTTIKGSVWGDISTTIAVGYNFGLPLAHMTLAKQLESYTTLRSKSPLYDQRSRRVHKLFDLSVTIIVPIAGILLHLSTQDRRFYIVEKFGPLPATYWDTWGVILMAVVPIIIAGAAFTFTIMALVNIHLRRQQMLSLIASDASVNRSQFLRLYFLTIAELGTCALRAIFNLMAFQNGPQPMDNRGAPFHNLNIIERVALSQITTTGMKVIKLQFYTVIACSFIFFLCFATSTETKKFYKNVVLRVFPCLPASMAQRLQNDSIGSTTLNGSHPSKSATSTTGSFPMSPTKSHYASCPSTPKERKDHPIPKPGSNNDLSLLDMLGAQTPSSPSGHASPYVLAKGEGGLGDTKTKRVDVKYREEDLDGVYLASYDEREKEKRGEV